MSTALALAPRLASAQAVPLPQSPEAEPPEEGAPAPSSVTDATGFHFHGYLRSGFGVDGSGKAQSPFQAPLSGAKYRLGNEVETYLETTFDYGVKTEGPDPAYFNTRITLAYVAPTSQSNAFATTFSLREAYATARHVWTAQPDATFWAGARFYDRHDVHIQDYYYRDPSGFGGGLDDISLGDRLKLAFAWIGGNEDQLNSDGTVPTNNFRLNKNTFDLKFYGMSVGRARVSVAVDLSRFNGDVLKTSDPPIVFDDNFGAAGTAIVEWPFKSGRDKLAIQYGTGAAASFRSVITPPVGRTFLPGEQVDLSNIWQFRIVNDFLIEHRGPWQLQTSTIYQDLDNGAAANNRVRWISIGGRPVYKLGRFFSLATEAGWDYTSQSGLPGGSLFKLTVAPQITPELKFLSRPSLRAYATWAHWSDSFRGRVASVSYPDDVQGMAFGVQLESWW
jgi:maltoporin